MTPSWIDKNYTCATHFVVPENIHTPPWKGLEIPWGWGGSQRPKNLSKCMKLDWNSFCGGGMDNFWNHTFQSTSRTISHQNEWSFHVYMILLQNFLPEWDSYSGTTTRVNSCRCDLCWHDILWWYHKNKIQSHEREPEWTCTGTNVTPVSM